MSSRSDIEAGKAHVRLYMKGSELVKGLNGIKTHLQGLGKTVMATGGLIAGLGALIIAPLSGALAHFLAVGGALDDMSARTGIARTVLGELKFAAEQSGAGLEDIEKSTARMQRTIVDAAGGVTTAKDALASLGLTAADLDGKLPDEQLGIVADRLAAIEDPAKKTAAAMEVFGKSGTRLLPMVGSLKELRAEAVRLGLAPTEESSKMADALGDAFDAVRSVIQATVYEIGSALAPVLLPAAQAVKEIAGAINRWVRENAALVRTVAMIGAGLAAAGAIITAVGATLFGLGAAAGVVATVIGALGTLFAALVSPIGLTVAAIVAAIAAWVRFTASGRAAVGYLSGLLGRFLAFGREVFGGIVDALMAGDLAAAGRVAMAGLMVAFQTAKLGIVTAWEDLTLRLLSIWDEVAIAAQMAVAFLASLWQSFTGGAADGFITGFVNVVVDGFNFLQKAAQTAFSFIAKAMDGLVKGLSAFVRGLRSAVSVAQSIDPKFVQTAALKVADNATGLDVSGAVGKASQAAADAEAAARNRLAGTKIEREAGRAGAIDAASGAVAAARAELDAALAAAARARKEAETRAAAGAPELSEEASAASVKQASVVTFSASALLAAGGGGNPIQRLIAVSTRTAVAVEGMAKDFVSLKNKPVPALRA